MSQNIQTILNQGQLFEDKEEYDKAYVLYSESLKKFPDEIDLVMRMAHIAELLNKPEESIEYWEKALELNPSDGGAYSKLTDLYADTDRYKYYMTRAKLKVTEGKATHAITDFKKALENAKDDKETVEAQFLLAQMYELDRKPHQAIEEYTKMLNIEDNVNVYFRLAELYEHENAGMAIDLLKRGIEAFPDSVNLKEKLAHILTGQNRNEEALEFAQTYEAQAKAYLASGENDKAFEAIKNIATKNERYFTLLAEYYFNAKDFDQCLETVTQLEKMNSLNPLPYQMKALVYEEKGDKFNASCNWGKCYSLSGKPEMALSEYLGAHHIEPKNIMALSEIVNIYENMNDKYTTAEYLEKLAAVDPGNVGAYKKLAGFCEKEGDRFRAIDYLEKAVEASPHDFAVFKRLAELYDKNRDRDNALKYYEKYLEKAPMNDETPLIKNKIEQLQSAEYSAAAGEDEEGLLDKLINFFTKSGKGK